MTREDLRQNLWAADTFIDFDHAVNTAVMKLREALGDAKERPLYIQTLPRKGYRFVAPVARSSVSDAHPAEPQVRAQQLPHLTGETDERRPQPISDADTAARPSTIATPALDQTSEGLALATSNLTGSRLRKGHIVVLFAPVLLLVSVGALVYKMTRHPAVPLRALTRLTFDDGLQSHATWSPDGHYLAYSSDKGGATNIWVQQIGVGDPIQVTRGPGPNWQPDWSPDGRFIAYRSEAGSPGIYIVPALGGAGQERMIASFGYEPKWSPDSSQVLLQSEPRVWKGAGGLAVAGLDGEAPHQVLGRFFKSHKPIGEASAIWLRMESA